MKAQEAARKAEQSKKPVFVLYVKSHVGRILVRSQEFYRFEEMRRSSQSGAKASLVLELVNTGNKDATNVNLSLTAESEYFLDCEQYTVERIPTPVEGSTTRILVKLGTIWAGKDKTVRCSATETPVLNRVTIYLGVEADQQLGGQQFPSPITIINNRRLNLQRQPGP